MIKLFVLIPFDKTLVYIETNTLPARTFFIEHQCVLLIIMDA